MVIRVHIDEMLAESGMTVTQFAAAVGITPANVAVLKNGRARAIRFTTLEAICRVLNCQPADILTYSSEAASPRNGSEAPDHSSSSPSFSGAAAASTSAACFELLAE